MVLIHLAATALALALHLLEVRHNESKELNHDGCRDVRHDTQRKDRSVGECTAGEHVQQRHQTRAGLLTQSGQSLRVDAGEHNERTETVHRSETQGDEDSRAQILNTPNIL